MRSERRGTKHKNFHSEKAGSKTKGGRRWHKRKDIEAAVSVRVE